MAKEEINVSITEERVKIYALSVKHKEKPFYATGVTDAKSKKLLTGQEDLTPAQLSKEEFIINGLDNYMIRHNDELILKKKGDVYIHDKDYALYNFYKVQPNIASSKQTAIRGTHDFYMQNFEAEAESQISISKLRAKAGAKVVEMNLADMLNMLYFFGENASSFTSKTAEARVYQLAETNPKEVVKYFDDLDGNQKIVFIKKLLSKGFIKRAEGNNYFMYNKVVLGANEEEAATFLYENKNESVYIPLKDMLDKS